MSEQDKARKMAEEVVKFPFFKYSTDYSVERLTEMFRQFAQERESEAVGELVNMLERCIPHVSHSVEIAISGSMMLTADEVVKDATALIAKHSKKGANDTPAH